MINSDGFLWRCVGDLKLLFFRRGGDVFRGSMGMVGEEGFVELLWLVFYEVGFFLIK